MKDLGLESLMKYYDFRWSDERMITGIGEAAEYDICRMIVGIHRAYSIFLSGDEIRKNERSKRYRQQLISETIEKIKLRFYASGKCLVFSVDAEIKKYVKKRQLDYANVKYFSKEDWGFVQAMLAIMPCVMTQAVLAGWSYTDISITKKPVELFFRYWAEEKIIAHKSI